MKNFRIISIRTPEELYDIIETLSDQEIRSISQETLYLIGLGLKNHPLNELYNYTPSDKDNHSKINKPT
jgi:hypothetical protein